MTTRLGVHPAVLVYFLLNVEENALFSKKAPFREIHSLITWCFQNCSHGEVKKRTISHIDRQQYGNGRHKIRLLFSLYRHLFLEEQIRFLHTGGRDAWLSFLLGMALCMHCSIVQWQYKSCGCFKLFRQNYKNKLIFYRKHKTSINYLL